MSDLLELAARCEAAEGADRVIDRELAKHLGWHRVEPRHARNKHGAWIAPEDFIGTYGKDGPPILDSLHGTTMHREVPPFTASLDAAMTLCSQPPSFDLSHDHALHGGKWQCLVGDAEGWLPDGRAHGNTPALALCAAALRARAATEPVVDDGGEQP